MGILGSIRNALTRSGAVARPAPSAGFFRDNKSPFLMQWRPALRESHEDIRAAWTDAAARAVDSIQNSGFITGLVEASTSLVVGTGLQLSARPAFAALGWSEEQANDWAEEVEQAWEAWCNDPTECDAQGRLTFGQMQELAYTSWLTYGEIVAVLPIIRRRGGAFTKVLMQPPSRLSQKSDGISVVHGVRVDGWGAPLGYVFDLRHAGNGFTREVEIARVDRDQREQVVHVFSPGLAVTRGISPLAPVLKVVRQIDQFADATLTAALIQTIFAATIRTDIQGADAFAGLMTEKEGELDVAKFAASKGEWYDASKIDLFTHGRIAHLFPNDHLEFHSSNHPSAQHDAFMGWLMREVARGAGVTYETATADYRGATYSSVRMATAENFSIVLKRRANAPAPFSQRVFETWLEDRIGAGQQRYPGGIEAFRQQRALAARARWSGPPKPQADDLKTARAVQTLIQIGVSSLETACVEYGTDWKAEMDRRAREVAYAKKKGLPNPHPFPADPAYKRNEQGSAEDKTDDPSYVPEGSVEVEEIE